MILLVAAALAASVPAQTSVVQMTAAQMFRLADEKQAGGDLAMAERVYRALLQDAKPEVATAARFKLAMLQVKAGRLTDAAVNLRRIVDEQPDATQARLELAVLLARMGDEMAARRELRAVRPGILPQDVALMVDRFSAALRARSPVGGSLKLAIAPDSNINRATRSDTLGTVIGDFNLNRDAQARSGIGMMADAHAFVRRPLAEGASLVASVSGNGRLYRRKDFNDFSLAVQAGPEVSLASTRLGLTAGHSRRWFGGRRLADTSSVQLSASRSVGQTTQVSAGAGLSLVNNHFNDLEDGTAISANLGVEHALSPRMGVGSALSLVRKEARDPAYSNRAADLTLFGWREIGRGTLSASVGVGRLEADERLAIYPERRSDRSIRASIGMAMRQLTLMGFAPTTRLTLERSTSSIEVYEFRRRTLELGLVRAF